MEDVWAFMGSSGRGNDDFELLEAVPMVEGIIGSDEGCSLRLTDPMITPRHARLERADGRWFLSQVAIASPTLVNGRAIELNTRTSVMAGDLIRMGTARFRVGGEPAARQAVNARDQASLLIWADQLAEQGEPWGERLLEGLTPDLSALDFEGTAAYALSPTLSPSGRGRPVSR